MSKVTVIDYGVGNILSVRRGLEHCGAEVCITNQASEILAASRVILPGVGAFPNAMAELERLNLVDIIQKVAEKGTPLLGICLGMQLLLDESDEFGVTSGLGLIPGRVVAIPKTTDSEIVQKIPHIGWAPLLLTSSHGTWANTILRDIEPGDFAYFVHSFMAKPLDSHDRIADCLYGGIPLAAVIGQNNVFGCQFHPEKSGTVGLNILKQFLALKS